MPMLAPYAVPRYAALARDPRLDVALLVETQNLTHRPGWVQEEVPGCVVVQVASLRMSAHFANDEFGYTVAGVRLVPYGLIGTLLRLRPEVVLVCNATELATVLPWRRLLGYRVGLLVEDTEYSYTHKSALSRGVRQRLYQAADFFMPFSEDSVAYLANLGIRDRLFKTSWSIDVDEFARTVDSSEVLAIRQEVRAEGRVLFLVVARLVPAKGIMDLLTVWSGLPSEAHERIALAIVGDGTQRGEIAEYIRTEELDNVCLVGHQDYDRMAGYYCASDVFVLPTHKDNFSLSVMEAMACGLPIITTIHNGARELVLDGVNGYVVDPRAIEQFRDAILSLTDGERLVRFGQASADMIVAYSHAATMRQYAEVLSTA